MTNQDRNKQLCAMLADLPHPSQFRTASALRGAQVRWLLDLADHIDALGLADTDELTTTARNAAFDLVGQAVDSITAARTRPVLVPAG